MGEGFINYAEFFYGLAHGGFEGSVAYEMCSMLRDGGSMETLDRYARLFLHYLEGVRADWVSRGNSGLVGAKTHPEGSNAP